MASHPQFEQQWIDLQQEVCNRFHAIYSPVAFSEIIGVASQTFLQNHLPVNGLRHPRETNNVSNWYVWAGEELLSAPDFFQPVHVIHLLEIYPPAIGYLGLPPGWRFLIAPGFEDVWFDESLLRI